MAAGDLVQLSGMFTARCFNPDGSLAWEQRFKNGATLEGLTHILATQFHGGAQITTWRLAPINNAGFVGLDRSDTMAAHAGWTEWTSYDEAARQDWVEGDPAGGIIATQTVATFTISAAGTLRGAFLTSSSTKGGTSGVLWATGEFDETMAVVVGQSVQFGYTCVAAGA